MWLEAHALLSPGRLTGCDASGLRDDYEKFQGLAEVLGISSDSPQVNAEFAKARVRAPGRVAGTTSPSASMCSCILHPKKATSANKRRGQCSSVVACPFWLQHKAGLLSRPSLFSQRVSVHAWRAAVSQSGDSLLKGRAGQQACCQTPAHPSPMPERSDCAGAQNQRLPFPLLSDTGELLRKNFDIKARNAPCSLPPSLLLAFIA